MLPFLQVSDVPKPVTIIVQTEKKETTKPVPYVIPPVEYTVVENDNLTKIAEAQKTTVQRLWEKNTNLVHPDQLDVGVKLVIPKDDEVLTPREMPLPPEPIVTPVASVQNVVNRPAVAHVPRGASSGNTYTHGYCTWHVKNLRPDLPNNLGNADTWYSRATAQGLATGTTPRVGAAAQTRGQMHVAYVTAVNGDTVTVSEMNVKGWNVVSTATYPASKFYYIY